MIKFLKKLHLSLLNWFFLTETNRHETKARLLAEIRFINIVQKFKNIGAVYNV